MRFHQLRHGARFEFKGAAYRKISPLKGASETDDSQRLIPRSAEVTLIDEKGEPVADQLPETLARRQVEAELANFLTACDRAAARLDPALTEPQRVALKRAISAAGQDLLTRLAVSSKTG